MNEAPIAVMRYRRFDYAPERWTLRAILFSQFEGTSFLRAIPMSYLFC